MADQTDDTPKFSDLVASVLPHIPADKMAALLSHPAAQDVIDAAGQAVAKQAGVDTIANPNNSSPIATAVSAPVASQESQDIANKVLQERAAAIPKTTTPAEDNFMQMLQGVGDLAVKQLVHGYTAAKESLQKGNK